MQWQFNILWNMDPTIMLDHEFIITILNNMPCNNNWWSTVTSLLKSLMPIFSLHIQRLRREDPNVHVHHLMLQPLALYQMIMRIK